MGKPASKPVAHSRFSSGTMRPVRGLLSETCLNQTALLLRFTGISSHTSNTFQVAPSPAPSTPGPRPRARIGLFRIPFSPEPVCPPSCGAKGVALRLFGSPSWVDREGAFLQLSAHAHGVFGICPLTLVATSALPMVDSRPLPPETRKETSSGKTVLSPRTRERVGVGKVAADSSRWKERNASRICEG